MEEATTAGATAEVVITEVVLPADTNSAVVRDGMGRPHASRPTPAGSRMTTTHSAYKGFHRYTELGCYSNMIRYGFAIGT